MGVKECPSWLRLLLHGAGLYCDRMKDHEDDLHRTEECLRSQRVLRTMPTEEARDSLVFRSLSMDDDDRGDSNDHYDRQGASWAQERNSFS